MSSKKYIIKNILKQLTIYKKVMMKPIYNIYLIKGV